PPSSPHFPYTTLFRSLARHLALGVASKDATPRSLKRASPSLLVNAAMPRPAVVLIDPQATRRGDLSRGLSSLGYEVVPALDERRSEEHTSELQSRENL